MPQKILGNLIRRPVSTSENWYLTAGLTAGDVVFCYQPKGAASLALSYTNLNNPGTDDAAPGAAPAWDATNGWKFAAASTQYLVAGATAPTEAYTFLYQFTNCAVGRCGCQVPNASPTSRLYLVPDTGTGNARYGVGANYRDAAPPLTAGNLGIAGRQGYRNGTAEGVIGGAGSGTLPVIYIGAINDGGSPSAYLTGYVQAAVLYSKTLDATQMAAIAAAMAAL